MQHSRSNDTGGIVELTYLTHTHTSTHTYTHMSTNKDCSLLFTCRRASSAARACTGMYIDIILYYLPPLREGGGGSVRGCFAGRLLVLGRLFRLRAPVCVRVCVCVCVCVKWLKWTSVAEGSTRNSPQTLCVQLICNAYTRAHTHTHTSPPPLTHTRASTAGAGRLTQATRRALLM